MLIYTLFQYVHCLLLQSLSVPQLYYMCSYSLPNIQALLHTELSLSFLKELYYSGEQLFGYFYFDIFILIESLNYFVITISILATTF